MNAVQSHWDDESTTQPFKTLPAGPTWDDTDDAPTQKWEKKQSGAHPVLVPSSSEQNIRITHRAKLFAKHHISPLGELSSLLITTEKLLGRDDVPEFRSQIDRCTLREDCLACITQWLAELDRPTFLPKGTYELL